MNTPLRFLATMALMIVSGWLALGLAVPPGYASPLWPPAGVALAALLLWGRGLWPAVWLGSFALNFWNGTQGGAHVSSAALMAALAIASGSTLQAMAAAWLARRWVDPGVPRLDAPKNILLFIVLTGPLACLIAPTMGVGALYLAEIQPAATAFFSWWNWWIGDSLGAIIIVPLMLCLFDSTTDLWKSRRLTVGLPLALALMGLVTIFVFVFHAEQSRVQLEFENRTAIINKSLVQQANNILDSTANLKDLFLASHHVSRRDFAAFSASTLLRHPEILALQWLPRIPHDKLEAFERSVRKEGFPAFRVTEKVGNSLQPTQERPEHFPVLYVEPMAGNETILGLDSAYHPVSRKFKQQAANTGHTTVSQRLFLAQRTDQTPAVLVVVPIYEKNAASPGDRPLAGLVQALVLPSQMAEFALTGVNLDLFGITLRDLSAPPAEAVLYQKKVRHPMADHSGPAALQHDFLFGGRTWQVMIEPSQDFVDQYSSTLPWITLVGGLVFTGLLSIYLLTITGRAAYITAQINERTRELRASEAKLAALFTHMTNGFALHEVIRDAEGKVIDYRILEVNSAYEKMTGLSRTEILGKSIKQILPGLEEHWIENYAGVVNTGGPAHFENYAQDLKRWYSTYSYRTEPERFAVVVEDITDRKLAEFQLRENEQKLNSILDNISAFVYIKDLEGRYAYINKRVADLWGTTQEQAIGKTDATFFDADTAAKLRENDKRVLVNGETLKTEETNLVALTGVEATYWSIKLPLRDENGHIHAMLGVSTDITERKQVERALSESEARFRQLFNSIPDPIFITSMDGRFLDVNDSACNRLGYTREELLQLGPAQIDTPEFGALVPQRLQKLQQFGHSVFESAHIARDGQVLPIELSNCIVQLNQQPVVLGVARDLSERKIAEQKLLESETKLRTIIDSAPECVKLLAADGTLLQMNRAGLDMIEADSADQVVGHQIVDLLLPQYRARFRTIFQKVFQGEAGAMEFEIRGLKGGQRWLSTHAVPLRDAQGNVSALLGLTSDITERKLAEEKLQLAARVFSEAHEGITITDDKGLIIDVNPTFCDITGYSRDEVIGQNTSLLKSGKHPPEFYASMWKALQEDGHWQGEVWNRKKNGSLYAELLTISALRNEQGEVIHYIGLFSDITLSKQQQQTLELMAHYDALTQLPNRVLFADRFNRSIARARREGSLLAVCYLDLDGFKQVNDSLGHEVGDHLLIEVASRIKSALREEDTVSRLGGDEFALLLGDLDSMEQCRHAMDRIHQAIALPYLIEGKTISIAASSGITLYPKDDADPDTLLRHADQAMYQAKLEGRNRYCIFDPTQDQQVQMHRNHLHLIEEAFARDEFVLYFQPKVNMRTGEVVGAEALIRWQHPERGVLPPSEFLPVIEGTTLETLVGNWVIEQALLQLRAWLQQGLELQLSINIAPRHLQWSGFYDHLDATLAKYPEVNSRKLELEILESSAMEDLALVSRVISECFNRLGVPFALDDFGTGYSSLTHLRHLQASTIKIDQSFVRDMVDDPDDFAIVEGVIGLSRAFRREVIAEGVETPVHGMILMSMQCDIAQGYAIAHPMPATALQQWIDTWKPFDEWHRLAPEFMDKGRAQFFILRLEVRQWLSNLEQCLNTHAPEAHWPTHADKKCHVGRWITQARRNNAIAPDRLDALEHIHDDMHRLASQLREQSLQGQVQQSPHTLEQLHAAAERLEAMLDALADTSHENH